MLYFAFLVLGTLGKELEKLKADETEENVEKEEAERINN